MNTFLYVFASVFIRVVSLLPLGLVLFAGRVFGTLAWWLDKRHRRVAIDNVTESMGSGLSPAEIHDIARENFRRLGECYLGSIKTAHLSDAAIRKVLTLEGVERIRPEVLDARTNIVFAIGHFGNFELNARGSLFTEGYRLIGTYRALRQPGLSRAMDELRRRSGVMMFERRSDADALKEAMREGGKMLGLLADQHAGDRAPRLPFFGRECSTSTAPAIFARRYGCPLHTAVCYRVGFGRWKIEIGPEIPLEADGKKRSIEDISRDVNAALEAAVKKDPANWFWVHRRWKPISKIQEKRQAARRDRAEGKEGRSSKLQNPNFK
tara:strand:+ start:4553 stop:5521 length:969 start_codon:yes stop_codon:yes gene_type:complete